MDRRCVIAGCGYVGRRLAVSVQRSWQVVAVTRAPATVADLRAAGIETIGVDFDSDQAAPELRSLADGAAVAYLAPPPNHGTTDPRLERFLGLLADARPAVLLYMSTTGVYGDAAGAAVDESSPAAPTNDRSRRRLAAERVAQSWSGARGTRCVILRVPGIYGPHRLPLERLQRGEPVLRAEDSGPGNRIHVDDLVACCIAAIERPVDGVFNVGDGDHASTTAFLQKVATLAGLQSPRLVSLAEARGQISPGMLEYLVESRRVLTTRMREELGVIPRYGILESGIAASLAEMRIR
ncbi:MAG TPA: NAD-dependent epimerase/dehydratase family protein [Steroidobacteraceae bacterium]|nr:NAD-dependent epimerase/dehydratase family protein [Steroidobacteraceae bacterium]